MQRELPPQPWQDGCHFDRAFDCSTASTGGALREQQWQTVPVQRFELATWWQSIWQCHLWCTCVFTDYRCGRARAGAAQRQ